MSKELVKINFGTFWEGFKKENNLFINYLSPNYDVEICDDPDLFFFTHSYKGHKEYQDYKCNKVFLGWENVRANWNIADYVLDSDMDVNNPRHKRYPIWAALNLTKILEPKKRENFLHKKKFCCMVVSNGVAKERIDFFKKLSKYKQVDSGGKFMNNVGGPVSDKIDFIKDYKFIISFENSASPGYTTEKLVDPMYVDSIPIYWGNPEVGKDFNLKSFINIEDTASFDKVIERIIELDQNDDKYMEMAMEPWFHNNEVPAEVNKQSMVDFFKFIVEDSKKKKPVSIQLKHRLANNFSTIWKKIIRAQ